MDLIYSLFNIFSGQEFRRLEEETRRREQEQEVIVQDAINKLININETLTQQIIRVQGLEQRMADRQQQQ